ncbi:MAG: D-alanyl-D-alanine carboxypeptidase [Candidatus Azotimanducaceae bacterium]|jgi:D-alanyl-D-alanine carboxypeptidase
MKRIRLTILLSFSLFLSTYSQVDKGFLLGKFDPAMHTAFDSIPDTLADREGLFLQREVLLAFVAMRDSALQDSVHLTIRSAARNFYYQKRIWQAKWNGLRTVKGLDHCKDNLSEKQKALIILRYSSMPGSSRHHWGTDIDLNDFSNSYFTYGKGKIEYQWLQANAAKFGFYQPYTKKGTERSSGYSEEKWHWSYFPLSNTYLESFQELVKIKDIRGFYGAATAKEIDIINKYVFGVAKSPK